MLEPLRQAIETLPIETQKRLLAIVYNLKQEQESALSQTASLESLRQQAIENGYDTKEKILDLIQQVKYEIIVEKESLCYSQIANSKTEVIEALPGELWRSLSDLKAVATLEQWQAFQQDLLRLVLDHRYQLIQAKIAEKIDKDWLDSLETEDDILAAAIELTQS